MRNAESVIRELKKFANPKNVEAMARYGITSRNVLGVSAPAMRGIARQLGKDHALAGDLWRTGILESRILAALVEEPQKVTSAQMDRWAKDFDSWAVCDGVCLHLFVKTPYARLKALRWSQDEREFVKRAGFTLIACLAVHDKDASDAHFERFFPAIEREAEDERNFVKKAVNWALRQIGKRNKRLNAKAITLARKLQKSKSPAARWVANDAIRELTNDKVKRKLKVRR